MTIPDSTASNRITSIDALRGIIMVIMAIDHTRDYFHYSALTFDPTDLSQTNVGLFITRWITHFCAPAFMLLSGFSAHITLKRKSKKELAWFLLTRGLWLMILDATVLRFAYFFSFHYDEVTFLSILWALGLCMVLMSVIIFLRNWAILSLALIILLIQPLFSLTGIDHPLWTIFMTRGAVALPSGAMLIAVYPIIPWLAIMMVGYVLGVVYDGRYTFDQRKRLLLYTGLLSIVLFLFLRATNLYGDPAPWVSQENFLFTILSFLNVSKYPVSLLFTLITIGPLLIILPYLELVKGRWQQPFIVFGSVPLFYFLLHFYVIHSAALISYMIKTGKGPRDVNLHFSESAMGGITSDGMITLPWVYLAWACIVVAIYPVCKWYARVKVERRWGWTSYL